MFESGIALKLIGLGSSNESKIKQGVIKVNLNILKIFEKKRDC